MSLPRLLFACVAIAASSACIGGRTPLPISQSTHHSFHPLSPLSTSQALSRKTTLTWDLASGMDGAVVTVCTDRACTQVRETHDVVGTSFTFAEPLPAGTYFWKLRERGGDAGGDAGLRATATWQFTVGPTQAVSLGTRPGPLDLDGDGKPDVAIGAPRAQGGEGDVEVYLGAQAGPPTVTLPGTTLRGLGTSLASALDVNGDGYGDLVVGARLGNAAGAFVYFGSATGIDPAAATLLHASTDAVAGLGDVDGDGYGDVLVGADLFKGNAHGIATEPSKTLAHGAVPAAAGDIDGDGLADALLADIGDPHLIYYYRGDRDKPLDSVSWRLSGPGGGYGSAFGCAGDVNGDGFADVIVGAPDFANSRGNAFVYLGNAHGLADSPAHVLIYQQDTTGRFGAAVGCAGDLDLDGFDEIVVGARSAGLGATGVAYVYRGGASGVTDHVAQQLDAPPPAFGFGGAFGEIGAGLLAVGAPGSASQSGSTFLYQAQTSAAGPLVAPVGAYAPSTTTADDGFGSSIAR